MANTEALDPVTPAVARQFAAALIEAAGEIDRWDATPS